ncbi:MAG: hypothetical protein KDD69_11650 [Bdellovibrionales bacterium]|nr:hypothetical protein [Bdellovibrionales bacterium]
MSQTIPTPSVSDSVPADVKTLLRWVLFEGFDKTVELSDGTETTIAVGFSTPMQLQAIGAILPQAERELEAVALTVTKPWGLESKQQGLLVDEIIAGGLKTPALAVVAAMSFGPQQQHAAVKALIACGEAAVPAVVDGLFASDIWIRTGCMRALRDLGVPLEARAVARLLDLAHNASAWDERFAVFSLYQSQGSLSSETRQFLREFADTPEPENGPQREDWLRDCKLRELAAGALFGATKAA